MKKKELLKRIEALEERVGALEGPTAKSAAADNTDPDRDDKPTRPPKQ